MSTCSITQTIRQEFADSTLLVIAHRLCVSPFPPPQLSLSLAADSLCTRTQTHDHRLYARPCPRPRRDCRVRLAGQAPRRPLEPVLRPVPRQWSARVRHPQEDGPRTCEGHAQAAQGASQPFPLTLEGFAGGAPADSVPARPQLVRRSTTGTTVKPEGGEANGGTA